MTELGELLCEAAVLRQRLFDLLFDAERVVGGSRPKFTKRMAIALAPGDDGLSVGAARADEGDDTVSQLAKGDRVEGCVVEPVDDKRVFAADTFESFERRAVGGGLSGMKVERRSIDFFADEGVGEVFRPAFAEGLGLRRIWRASGRACPPIFLSCRGPCGRSAVVDPDCF